jgi:hypothetical protein
METDAGTHGLFVAWTAVARKGRAAAAWPGRPWDGEYRLGDA